jgi:hypothetical protein
MVKDGYIYNWWESTIFMMMDLYLSIYRITFNLRVIVFIVMKSLFNEIEGMDNLDQSWVYGGRLQRYPLLSSHWSSYSKSYYQILKYDYRDIPLIFSLIIFMKNHIPESLKDISRIWDFHIIFINITPSYIISIGVIPS